MSTDKYDEAKFQLRKILTTGGIDLAFTRQWLHEDERWQELVFALLTRIARLPEAEMRDLTHDLGTLTLLEIPALASLCEGRRGVDFSTTHARRFLDMLQERGLSRDEAQRALTTICEAALIFKTNYGGKVQRYLRTYGELMLHDLRQFRFSALAEADARYAFIYWLQNVLNMPLSLLDENMQTYCRQHDLKPEELIAAADELDLNLALVDDLTQRYLARQTAEKDDRKKD